MFQKFISNYFHSIKFTEIVTLCILSQQQSLTVSLDRSKSNYQHVRKVSTEGTLTYQESFDRGISTCLNINKMFEESCIETQVSDCRDHKA
jgi:hypothetical protein